MDGILDSSVQYLGGVGPRRAQLLASELGIETVRDLLEFYPFRYIDRSGITPISEARAELAYIQIRARVVSRTLYGQGGSVITPDADGRFRPGSCKRLSVIVEDSSGRMELVFFKGLRWTYGKLVPGSVFVFFGKPQVFGQKINLVHPEIDAPFGAVSESRITGVYPSTEKLKAAVTGKMMCTLEANALRAALPQIEETLPEYVMREKGLVSLRFALQNIHFPKDQQALEQARRRLKFEELFLLQLSLLRQKYRRSRAAKGYMFGKVGHNFHSCYNALPYSLTEAQKRVIREIRADMSSGSQMNRLLQGDVGSGKTMVAVLSCLIAEGNGFQSCIMAPTEVLAQQHYANIGRYLAPTSVRCALLTGSTGRKERREIHAGLEDGSIGIIVGTHALIEDDVKFRRLGLAVIDEQHRFGVEQRSRLWAKGGNIPPHVLVMTATPIPRTLAMTLYGDLDISVIDELPPGRKPVKTLCVGEHRKAAVYGFMKKEISKGRQVFVVYPLIFESEKTDYKNLEKGYEEIVEAFPLPDYKVAIVHGRQSSEEKNFNMSAFAAGRADILVSTTVIEVGVDVPNASVMVIESAQRFGLSQLHQLRGRVGRGAQDSYCILVKDDKTGRDAQARLDLMCSTEDGFEIAEQDMRMRGPGDIEGTQQSGLPVNLHIASLARDGVLLSEAREYAARVLSDDPELSGSANRLLAQQLRRGRYEIHDFSKIS